MKAPSWIPKGLLAEIEVYFMVKENGNGLFTQAYMKPRIFERMSKAKGQCSLEIVPGIVTVFRGEKCHYFGTTDWTTGGRKTFFSR